MFSGHHRLPLPVLKPAILNISEPPTTRELVSPQDISSNQVYGTSSLSTRLLYSRVLRIAWILAYMLSRQVPNLINTTKYKHSKSPTSYLLSYLRARLRIRTRGGPPHEWETLIWSPHLATNIWAIFVLACRPTTPSLRLYFFFFFFSPAHCSQSNIANRFGT